MEILKKPQIAILASNTLTSLGLKNIIEEIMPGAEACIFYKLEDLESANDEEFFHYFVSAEFLMTNANFFIERQNKTIILVHGEEGYLPLQMHKLNICQPEELLIKNILKLEESSHKTKRSKIVQKVKCPIKSCPLTHREIEVLRLVVSGLINKEIAKELEVGLATIITHRKNIVEKLNIKSVSGLTIYAVTHGIIKAEEI